MRNQKRKIYFSTDSSSLSDGLLPQMQFVQRTDISADIRCIFAVRLIILHQAIEV